MRVPVIAVLSVTLLFAVTTPVRSQTPETVDPTSLQDTIMSLDRALFDAFNRCDLVAFRTYLDENIEFYQDNDDVTTTRDELEPTFRSRCADGKASRLRRELLPETVEVHPIQGYGAVQLGTHRFWVTAAGEPDHLASTPRFVHLWHNRDGRWRITRVISFGH
ncbi:MAG: nuclear transport factor 2 family protein [Gemmatimonadota bacterium]